ncbi:MAG: hypothetical protein QMC89_04435 [Candidatus Hodarchaeaceae archaeon]|nr:hypothetical protein [Candidatus Hodarchaeaceae archaeon]
MGEALTQANLRILLKILEAEVQSPYGVKFGLELARSLYNLNPTDRIGYVFYSGEEYWCKFRPTLSLPKGLESHEEIKQAMAPEKAVELFNRQIQQIAQTVREKEEKAPELSEEEKAVVKALKEFHKKGIKPNKSQLQRQIKVGREKIVDLIDSLKKKGIVKVVELKEKEHPKVVELLSGCQEEFC